MFKKSKLVMLSIVTISLISCNGGNNNSTSSTQPAVSSSCSSSPEVISSSSSSLNHTSSSSSSTKITSISYGGKDITLSSHALYVNQSLTDKQVNEFVFNSLSDVANAAIDGDEDNPTVIYLEPDVYWTDDYSKTDIRATDDLIGISFKQSYLKMIGMSSSYSDTVIASDRGQNAGANGNFNTIGLGYAFTAQNITFGNYCNVDLVYSKDHSKDHSKRQASITQAQTITNAKGATKFDRWYFNNCSFVSRLNLLAGTPNRSYFRDCHLECTDDSLSMGKETIFDSCDIDLYANHPTWSAASDLQAFLNCKIEGKIEGDDHKLYLTKYIPGFTLIDTAFSGNITSIEWANPDDSSIKNTKNMIFNSTLNGEQLRVSQTTFPEATYIPNEEELKAFRIKKGSYNIYNLLNSATYDSAFDPLSEKGKDGYDLLPWNIKLSSSNSSILEGNGTNKVTIKATVLGGDKNQIVSWSSESLDVVDNKDNSCSVSFTNAVYRIKHIPIYAKLSNGLTRVIYLNVYPTIGEAPSFESNISLSNDTKGYLQVNYDFSNSEDINSDNYDMSDVTWYSSLDESGTNKLEIAGSTFVKDGSTPHKKYVLKGSDVGKYITCIVKPQLRFTKQGNAVSETFKTKITKDMVLDENKDNIDTDFSGLAYHKAINDTIDNNYEWKDTIKNGYFYGGTYLPKEYRQGGIYQDKNYICNSNEKPWTYAYGTAGSAGVAGLQTTTQGARLVYKKEQSVSNMKMTINLSPAKTSCQGFGSAKQYFDTYIKYDPLTQSGYGLRIMRVGTTEDAKYKDYLAKSCRFSLMKYANGVASELGESITSTAFNSHVTICLNYVDKVLSADISTDYVKASTYPDYMSNHPILSYTVTDSNNGFGGFGFQCTGTAGAGKDGNRTTISHLKVEY